MSAPPPYIPPNALFTSVKASAINVAGPLMVDTLKVSDAVSGTVVLSSGQASVGSLALTSEERVFVTSNGGTTGTIGALAVSTTMGSFVVSSSVATDNATVSWLVVSGSGFA